MLEMTYTFDLLLLIESELCGMLLLAVNTKTRTKVFFVFAFHVLNKGKMSPNHIL